MSFAPEDNNLAYTIAGIGRKKDPYEQRRTMAQRLIAQGTDTSPIQSPWQGVARLAQAAMGGFDSYAADRDEKKATEDRNTKLAAVMAEQDPQKRIGLLAAIDPEYGARISGQMAVEQAKIDRQTQGLGQIASGYGAPGPTQAGPPSGGGGVNPNNIGNVRPVGASSGFQQPATLDDGVRLAVNNVRAYPAKFNNGQPMTLVQIGQRWAPVGDGANDPRQWAMNVASIGGLDPNQPLDMNDPATAAKFARGVHGAEHGANKAMPVDAYARILTGGPSPQIAQGAADTNGMPPTPSPQGVQSPTMVAPPQIPQRMTPRDMPPQMAAPYIDRLRRGGYGMNPAEAEQRMVADMQRALDVSFENQKLEYQRLQGDYEYRRKRGDDQTGADQKRTDEQRKQTIEAAGKLRDDFNNLQSVKDYNKASTVFRSAVEAAKGDTKAGDINMVYAFATLMDPGSVVRDSETGMVYATAGASDRVKGLVAGLQGKSGLGKETKAALLKEMGTRYESYKSSHDNIIKTFSGIAERSGLNKDDVIIPVEPVEWKNAAAGPAQPKTKAEYDQLPPGAQYIAPDGSTRTKGGGQ